MSSFIPAGGRAAEDRQIQADGFWPTLSVADCRGLTGLGNEFTTDRIANALTVVAFKVNRRLAGWRASQAASTLAQVPAPTIDGKSEKVTLYQNLIYFTVRAEHLATTRDYDSTKDGHARADALEPAADVWRQLAAEAEAAFMEQPRMIVELI